VIRTGIIGCGKIADQHAEQIVDLPGCELVAVCDREPLMARQLWERFGAQSYHTEIDEFLEMAKPDVVHLTTPPHSHFELGMKCLDAGIHLYIEKPFTLNAFQARQLIEEAEKKGLKVTVGHNGQFSHAAIRMRDLIGKGYLGGPPFHMESYFGYNLGDTNYARALLSDKDHWVRKLPGQLLHNIISHGVSRISEYIHTTEPHVVSLGFSSPLLKSIGEEDIIDELRVTISDGDNVTAYFTFSSQMRPILHQFRLYGSANGLVVDEDDQTVIKLRGTGYKSYLNLFIPPLERSAQYLGNFTGNLNKFLRNDFHMTRGMKILISSFYDSITKDSSPPIPYREIILTAEILDRIFQQIYPEQ